MTTKGSIAEKEKRLIQAHELLNRLRLFKEGKVSMSRAQILAARIVIRKSIPPEQWQENQLAEGAT